MKLILINNGGVCRGEIKNSPELLGLFLNLIA
jgi:hypothetical protein